MKKRTAIKTDLFADDHHRKKFDTLGDLLAEIESHIDFAALASEVDRVAQRPVSLQGGLPLMLKNYLHDSFLKSGRKPAFSLGHRCQES